MLDSEWRNEGVCVTLDIIVESAVHVAVLAQQTEGVNVCKILKLNQTVHPIPENPKWLCVCYHKVEFIHQAYTHTHTPNRHTVQRSVGAVKWDIPIILGALSRCTRTPWGQQPGCRHSDLRLHQVPWMFTALLKCCICYKSGEKRKLKSLRRLLFNRRLTSGHLFLRLYEVTSQKRLHEGGHREQKPPKTPHLMEKEHRAHPVSQ